MNADFTYCRDQVEKYDRDRYILSLAAEQPFRAGLWALYAFNHEIAKTRESVREMNAGYIRLAWWREALHKPEAPAHDVARALAQTIATYTLDLNLFETLLDARELDLGDAPPASMDGLVSYADATNTPLLQLSAKILGTSDTTLNHLGIAYGLTGIIRALPFYAQQNRCALPLPVIYDLKLMPEQFHHLKSSAALSNAVSQIVAVAQTHLSQVKTEHPFFRKQVRMTAFYLKRIAGCGYDPFNTKVCGPVPFLGFRV